MDRKKRERENGRDELGGRGEQNQGAIDGRKTKRKAGRVEREEGKKKVRDEDAQVDQSINGRGGGKKNRGRRQSRK